MDGVDQSKALKGIERTPIRNTVLLDLYTDSHDGSAMEAFRKGKYKLIKGYIRDPNWYYEPTQDQINTTDTGMFVRFIENLARFTDWLYGHVPNDLFRAWMSN